MIEDPIHVRMPIPQAQEYVDGYSFMLVPWKNKLRDELACFSQTELIIVRLNEYDRRVDDGHLPFLERNIARLPKMAKDARLLYQNRIALLREDLRRIRCNFRENISCTRWSLRSIFGRNQPVDDGEWEEVFITFRAIEADIDLIHDTAEAALFEQIIRGPDHVRLNGLSYQLERDCDDIQWRLSNMRDYVELALRGNPKRKLPA